jgi:hypothetical protein
MTKPGYYQGSTQSARPGCTTYKWVGSITSLIDLARSNDAGEAKSARRPACKTRAETSSGECVDPAPRRQCARHDPTESTSKKAAPRTKSVSGRLHTPTWVYSVIHARFFACRGTASHPRSEISLFSRPMKQAEQMILSIESFQNRRARASCARAAHRLLQGRQRWRA